MGGISLSVPAMWREQGQMLQPFPFYHHHTESALLYHRSSKKFNETRAPAFAEYCEMFDKISDAPSLYMCKLCGKTVSNRWHHSAIHRPQSNRCPLCQQSFTRKDNMKAHIRLKHGPLMLFELLGDPRLENKNGY